MNGAPARAIPLRQIAADGAVKNNVVTVRLLALCPLLAVSHSTAAAAALGLVTLLVMAAAGAAVSTIRGQIPAAVRLPVFLIVVATLVGASDLLMEAFAPAMRRQLGIFLPLVVTNCAVLARLELFAKQNRPLAAAADGAASGAGMTAAVAALAIARELIGKGEFFGAQIFPSGIPLALLPAGGFIIFALMLAAWRGVFAGKML